MNVEHLKEQDPSVYSELFEQNSYNITPFDVRGKTVFDLGANKGFFSIMCANYGAKKIIAVEAQPQVFNGLLQSNTKGIKDITLINRAVTNESCKTIRIANDDTGSSLYSDKNNTAGDEVATISLTDLTASHYSTNMLLKLDIEGAEYDVLMESSENTIRKFQTIVLEVYGEFHPKYKGLDILLNRMKDLGYLLSHQIQMFDMYGTAGNITYKPLPIWTCKFVRMDKIGQKTIVISPFSKILRTNKENPKNYPYWTKLLDFFKDYHIIQVGINGEKRLVDDFRTNLPYEEVKKLVKECEFWISVDSFLPHLAHHVQKPGAVIWSASDPNIFGYDYNVNVLKDRKYLRANQFGIWEECPYSEEAFLPASEVYERLKPLIGGNTP